MQETGETPLAHHHRNVTITRQNDGLLGSLRFDMPLKSLHRPIHRRYNTFVLRGVMSLVLALPALAGFSASAAEPPQALEFSEFFQTPVGRKGLELSDTLRRLNGQRVSLTGYMVKQEHPIAGRFWFAPLPLSLSEHADGDASDLPASTVMVTLDPLQLDRVVEHRSKLLRLTGILDLGRKEDEIGRVTWIRLKLDAEQLAPAISSSKSAP